MPLFYLLDVNLMSIKINSPHLHKKTFTVVFLTKQRVKNNGVLQYYVEYSHEVIIPRVISMQVQEQLARRRIVHTSLNGKNREDKQKLQLENAGRDEQKSAFPTWTLFCENSPPP